MRNLLTSDVFYVNYLFCDLKKYKFGQEKSPMRFFYCSVTQNHLFNGLLFLTLSQLSKKIGKKFCTIKKYAKLKKCPKYRHFTVLIKKFS
jgi:hypothetical protein